MATPYQTLADNERALQERFLAQARAADEWEGYRHPHATRIADLADALAQTFYLAPQDRAALHLASLAHDFGMLAMRRDYVKRSGPLSLEEQLDLARHPIIGEQEAARLGAPRAVQLIVRWHHEAWHGLGYPDMLRGEQSPLSARILHVADAYAALTDERPYRPARTEKDALRFIRENAGLEFDPAIVQSLLALEDLPALQSYARATQVVAPVITTNLPAFVPEALPVPPLASVRENAPATPLLAETPPENQVRPSFAPESQLHQSFAPQLETPPITPAPALPSHNEMIAPPSSFNDRVVPPAPSFNDRVALPPAPFNNTVAPPPAPPENSWPIAPVLSPPAPERERVPTKPTGPPAPVLPPDEDWWK